MTTVIPVGVGAGKRRSSLSQMIADYGLPRTVLALFVGVPKTRVTRLKPTGYNAFIERITQPMLILASVALTTGAVFVLAEGLIQQASTAIGSGHVPSFQVLLALSTLFVIGFLIDTSLITSGSRFRMHALRGERGWAILSGAMLLLCVGVEGMTWSYLLFELEPTVLPASVAAFIRGIPSVLFFVRAYMGPVCLVYLTAGVLPLTIQRGDVNRQTAALAGSAIVTAIKTLVRQIEDFGLASPQQAVTLLELLFTLFRVSAKHETEAEDKAMVDAFRDLSNSIAISVDQLSTTLAHVPPVDAQVEDQRVSAHLQELHQLTEDTARGDAAEQETPGLLAEVEGEVSSITPARGRSSRRGPPRPGTKAFQDAVYQAILTVQRQGALRTFYTIAKSMGDSVQPDDVKVAFEAMRKDRENKLMPGARPQHDPVLDDAALVTSSVAA